MTAVQAQDVAIPYDVQETFLKIRKGTVASLNAKRVEAAFAFMPGWKIEKTKMMKPSNGGWVLGREVPGGSTYHRSFMKNKDGRIHFTASMIKPDIKGSDSYEAFGRAEDERKIDTLKNNIFPALVALAAKTQKKWNVRDVQMTEAEDQYSRVETDVSFIFEVECGVFVITSPDGQTYEVFGDYKNGAIGETTFVSFFEWAKENTDLVETACSLIGMEPVEKKHDPRTPYTPPPGSLASEKFIFGVLKDLTAGVRAEQKAQMIEWMHEDVDTFLAARQEDATKADDKITNYLGAMTYRVWNSKEKTLRPEWETAIEEIAEQEVEAMQNMFVYKNTRKLSPIINGKAGTPKVDVLRITVRRGIIEANLRMTFEDGSSFNVRQSTVSSYATDMWNRVTYFYRFPTTFHDAILADGSRIKNVDEEAMNTEFVGK